MNHQEQTTSNRRPARQNGWLKMTLATSGMALTMIGTGLLARNEAVNTAVNTLESSGSSEVETAVEPLPTLAVPNFRQNSIPPIIPNDESENSRNQLVVPAVPNQTMPQLSTRSRSSR